MDKTLQYMFIWAMLVLATIGEVITRYQPLAFIFLVGGIIMIASFKAVVIALYYQRLRHETWYRALLPVAGVTVLILLVLASIFAVGL